MIDFSSLIVLTGLLFGFLAADEAIYGDTLRVQIAVPQALTNAGFSEASAEAVFMAEAIGIVRGESIIPAPSLKVSTTPSVITVLAKPLSLDSIVTAMQAQLGIDHLIVTGAILAETGNSKTPAPDPVRPLTPGTKLDMVVVVVQPKQPPVQTVLEQADGDATTLVKRAAGWAMEQVSPYRVVLSHFIVGINGDQASLVRAKEAANRFLAKPWDPARASERAMTHNVLSLLNMLDNKLDAADAELALTLAIPDVVPQARAELAINHSFIAIAQKNPQEAAAMLAASRKASEELDLPGFAEHLDIQEALIAWGAGNAASAETKLRGVTARSPDSETAHHYLSLLLHAKGDMAGAAKEEAAERTSHRFEIKSQGLAVLQFWTDPLKGGVTRRL